MNIGERIGDYEIAGILGAGGMGQVYKVRNVLSDRIEAMKVVLPNLAGDADLAERFLREIKVQAALDHPNIAKLNTAMQVGNQLVMVMEFVDGTSLAQVLESGPIPASAVVSYIAQVLDALAYAHARGVIHRDIKPANIMLLKSPSGAIKLMDFGIARMKADRQLTQTGSTVGSLFYMSPEQIQGGAPDPRSDLYSVGVTMYEMVTGRRPFLGGSDFSIMTAHLQQVPAAPIQVMPGVPGVVNDLIMMAIEKDPAMRFQSAQAFRAALANAFPQAVPNEVATKTMNVVTPPVLHPAAPPPPPPVAAPVAPQPQAPPISPSMPPPPVQGKSRRWLYMALGSLLTLAVLVAAIVEGPKLMRGGAADAQGGATSVAAPGAAAPVSQPAAEPVATPVAEPVARPVSQPAAQAPRAVVQQAAPAAPPEPAQAPTQRPAAQEPPDQHAAPAAASNRAAQAEINELRQRYNEISIRASTAQAGVRSIEQQMARQGLGLRNDIREAQTRLDFLMQEANMALQSGDTAGARQNLQYAEGTIAILNKFLGR